MSSPLSEQVEDALSKIAGSVAEKAAESVVAQLFDLLDDDSTDEDW